MVDIVTNTSAAILSRPNNISNKTSKTGDRFSKAGNNTYIPQPRWQHVGNKAAVFPSAVDKHQLRWSTSIIFSTDETHSRQQKWNGGKILAFH